MPSAQSAGSCKSVARCVLCGLLCLSHAYGSLADRPANYVPPTYWDRLGRSLFTIAPMALCAAIIPYVLMWFIDRTRASGQKWRFLGIVLALTFVAIIVAAADGWNDEMWNPSHRGAIVLSVTLPIAIVRLTDRIGVRWRVVLALLALLPCYLLLRTYGLQWQWWAFEHGLPAAW